MCVFSSSTSTSGTITRAVKAGRMRKIASKLYTDDLTSSLEEIVHQNRLEIIANFYSGGVISHRSALEGKVSPRGKFHITFPGADARCPLPTRTLGRFALAHARKDRRPVTLNTDILASFAAASSHMAGLI